MLRFIVSSFCWLEGVGAGPDFEQGKESSRSACMEARGAAENTGRNDRGIEKNRPNYLSENHCKKEWVVNFSVNSLGAHNPTCNCRSEKLFSPISKKYTP